MELFLIVLPVWGLGVAVVYYLQRRFPHWNLGGTARRRSESSFSLSLRNPWRR
ncbi:hypothetical protein FBZ90_101177 [Nitrospirillum pindoramense]|uniref:Uncharacterized protein n=1 Tax=Nitrospirillum amazonense TaxID=28077 RepID=A0A560HHA7_9PROT|nr:hypothetical protein FBZ90_101177 [Nitrospirillum amazonense]